MILVKYSRKNDSINKILVKGHANYDIKNKDIVCSAVSACVIGGFNSLESVDKYSIVIEDGYVEFNNNNYYSDHDKIVLETIIIQLMSIENNYSKYLKIENVKGW